MCIYTHIYVHIYSHMVYHKKTWPLGHKMLWVCSCGLSFTPNACLCNVNLKFKNMITWWHLVGYSKFPVWSLPWSNSMYTAGSNSRWLFNTWFRTCVINLRGHGMTWHEYIIGMVPWHSILYFYYCVLLMYFLLLLLLVISIIILYTIYHILDMLELQTWHDFSFFDVFCTSQRTQLLHLPILEPGILWGPNWWHPSSRMPVMAWKLPVESVDFTKRCCCQQHSQQHSWLGQDLVDLVFLLEMFHSVDVRALSLRIQVFFLLFAVANPSEITTVHYWMTAMWLNRWKTLARTTYPKILQAFVEDIPGNSAASICTHLIRIP